MRLLLWLLLTVLFVIPSALSAGSQTPYLFYFSDILHAFVIERADGTDSRQIGRGIIPAGYNSADGAGWSPSGRWLAFSAYRSNYHGFTSDPRISGIISADGLSFIPLQPPGAQSWSPTEDLFAYAPRSESAHLQIMDPNLNQVVYEHVFAGTWGCYSDELGCPVVWNDDGTQLALSIWQGENLHFYTLQLPEFRLEEMPAFDEIARRVDNLVVYMGDDNEIRVHDLFAHQEWRYSQNSDPALLDIHVTTTWNPQHTQAILRISYYRESASPPLLYAYFLLALDQPTLLLIYEVFDYPDDISSIIWSPEGDRVALLNPENITVMNTSTLEEVELPAGDRVFWLEDSPILVQRLFTPELGDAIYLTNIETLESQRLDLPLGIGNTLYAVSPDGRYVQISDSIYDLTTLQQVARSRLSGEAIALTTHWNMSSDWVIEHQWDMYPCCGIHAMFYEAVHLSTPTTRELNACYGTLCAGWLPAAVEAHLAPNGRGRSVVPSPIQVFTAESAIQRVTWSEDSARLQIITSTQETNPSIVTEWELATGTTTRTVVPYCRTRGCVLSRDIEHRYVIEQAPLPLLNGDGSYRLLLDPILHMYEVQDTETQVVVQNWAQDRFFVPVFFTWLENTLIMFYGSASGACFLRWHPVRGVVTTAEPLLCEFSPDNGYLVVFNLDGMRKASLMDTVTGEETRINFYAREAMFSPDGTRLALSSRDLLTIWDVEEILSAR